MATPTDTHTDDDTAAAPQAEDGAAQPAAVPAGSRLRSAAAALVPPEIWSTDRPSLSRQYDYARAGAWGPREGRHRIAALVAFWAVSFPTSAAAYYLEWIGERPARWLTALVLCSLTYHLPYVPEVVGVLIRIPAWPITAAWSLLGLL